MELKLLDSIEPYHQALADLLIDCVHDGASIGFVPPLSQEDARAYWNAVMADLRGGGRLLLAAFVNGELAGSVQLSLCGKKNGLHRAEVEKLMTHTSQRRMGVGQALLTRIEQLAQDRLRTLLVLDTRSDDNASRLYLKCHYIEAGRIPSYALSANGELEGTTYFYKLI